MKAAHSNQPVVLTQRLTKVFKDFWLRSRVRAVDSLDLSIERGEIFGLLGPNGSGKSTTIKMMLGLLHITSGRIAVFGKPPSDVQTKRRIGVLPEESYLYPFLTARETLDYYAKLFSIPHVTRRKRTEELLDMVGLTAVADRQVKEYSKGMQRRIGLAQALINDPEFLVLDEPTSGLDPIGTRQVKDLIIEMGRRGKTILLSSHQLSDVEDVVDRLAILYGGRKRAEGTCDELLIDHKRTLIEIDAADDEQIDALAATLKQNTGHRIRQVIKPRQRLEELFLDIVEQAVAEKIETAGAGMGGQTAEFLKADEQLEGDALITQLVSKPQDEPRHETTPTDDEPTETRPTTGTDLEAITELMKEPDSPAPTRTPPRQEYESPEPDEKLNLDLISDLMDDDETQEPST
ncbi:MAG: ABC transporter ATP-binding protein [Planctomycetota bacterium]|jgi:ABC-2 type transport system ATP-binding protein